MKIEGLNGTARHRVIVYRARKAQQSFAFRLSEFKSPTPCLFLNDLYWTVQFWEAKQGAVVQVQVNVIRYSCR
jgi:hypothetical protein